MQGTKFRPVGLFLLPPSGDKPAQAHTAALAPAPTFQMYHLQRILLTPAVPVSAVQLFSTETFLTSPTPSNLSPVPGQGTQGLASRPASTLLQLLV